MMMPDYGFDLYDFILSRDLPQNGRVLAASRRGHSRL